MAHTERRFLTHIEGSAWWDYQGRHEVWCQERWVSHSKTCWMCGKGKRAKRLQRSKPRRQQAKRDIREQLKNA